MQAFNARFASFVGYGTYRLRKLRKLADYRQRSICRLESHASVASLQDSFAGNAGYKRKHRKKKKKKKNCTVLTVYFQKWANASSATGISNLVR